MTHAEIAVIVKMESGKLTRIRVADTPADRRSIAAKLQAEPRPGTVWVMRYQNYTPENN